VRRAILIGAIVVTPLVVSAQQSVKLPRVGIVGLRSPHDDCTRPQPRSEALLQGLRDLGYVPERSIVIDRRCYMNDEQLRKALSDFIRLKTDVIVAGNPAEARAAREVTKEVPIVCVSCGDPVDGGLVTSLARPGVNLTGLGSVSYEIWGKRVQLLKETVPGVSRVAAVLNPDNPSIHPTLRALAEATRVSGIEIQRIDFRSPGDFEQAFRSAANLGVGAVLIQDDPKTYSARGQIADLALKHRLPSVSGTLELAEAGLLIAYGPDRIAMWRRGAMFIDKILKGAKPGDLPFEQPTKYQLVINMKTAKALGMTIPSLVLLRADRVIE